MYAKVIGETTCGINGEEIIVEVDISNGYPAFDLVGLPDTAVRESRERVRSAVRNSGYRFPATRITVNLAPADIKKDSSGLDLPITIGIICAIGQLSNTLIKGKCFVGEVALNGEIRSVSGILPMIIDAKNRGYEDIFIPKGNAPEGELVEGIHVYAVENLAQVIEHLNERSKIVPLQSRGYHIEKRPAYEVDFADVQGQFAAKRALEIAAAGGHNVRMIGAPGAGKTMLARRLPTILPPMTEEEALEVTKIYSIAGILNRRKGLITERPFRSPHHTISHSALIGGGSLPRPGEVTLSHNGVLFLDELPEFSRMALEVLRQPLEDGFVTISRVQATLSFPAVFLMISAENPCPCGFYEENDSVHECTCSSGEIERYHKRLSGPLLDRIDIQIHVPRLDYNDMKADHRGELSSTIRKRVIKARELQLTRMSGTGLHCNAEMRRQEIKNKCFLTNGARRLLEMAFNSLGLSARSHDRIIKVARTIADLEQMEEITEDHLAEAIQLRTITKA
ncbi:MAG TPA: YifB family Mg chelatase-like AAA ATPase [Candidatus Avacidaminococcus intestinavium]|uniref:YifB family Mg chelatase-like AAA ATPase n=1 Tax=Candidatus Avacidaminococcus intestinavium TaxID=2840684 RepID=A0A9D1SKF7_9FIRM|nr:YifB family Mg chelatase-like AAA ATPase [Candidatus Avacidaminococcus intestinavium]